jgi:hypothetical protein
MYTALLYITSQRHIKYTTTTSTQYWNIINRAINITSFAAKKITTGYKTFKGHYRTENCLLIESFSVEALAQSKFNGPWWGDKSHENGKKRIHSLRFCAVFELKIHFHGTIERIGEKLHHQITSVYHSLVSTFAKFNVLIGGKIFAWWYFVFIGFSIA